MNTSEIQSPIWEKGHFQVHFIYTGVAESMFMIFPDGTSMLLDCGDHPAITRLHLSVPVKPGPERLAGDWVARYVEKVNPYGSDVDYMMISHFHSDHTGTPNWRSSAPFGNYPGSPGAIRPGADYYRSGFGLAAERLHFKKAIDRGWPDYNDPVVPVDSPDREIEHMKKIYAWLKERDGLEIEKFRVGDWNQIAPLKNPAECTDFSIFNLCGNGKIATEDGAVRDVYGKNADYMQFRENGVSLGNIFSYGKFRFFSAGDFSDPVAEADGSIRQIEDNLAEVVPHVDVAKISHHGHHSMTPPLVQALSARVWIACVWDQLHLTPDTFERLTDRSIYSDERTIFPGYMPNAIREMSPEKRRDVPEVTMAPVHFVLDVRRGGKTYSITAVSAEDETMKPLEVFNFASIGV